MTSRVCAVCGSRLAVTIAQAWSGPKIIDPPATSAVTAMPLERRNCLRRSPSFSIVPSLGAHGPFGDFAAGIPAPITPQNKLIVAGRTVRLASTAALHEQTDADP